MPSVSPLIRNSRICIILNWVIRDIKCNLGFNFNRRRSLFRLWIRTVTCTDIIITTCSHQIYNIICRLIIQILLTIQLNIIILLIKITFPVIQILICILVHIVSLDPNFKPEFITPCRVIPAHIIITAHHEWLNLVHGEARLYNQTTFESVSPVTVIVLHFRYHHFFLVQ